MGRLQFRAAAAAASLAVALLGVLAVPTTAGAQSGAVLWVNNTVPTVGGTGQSCTQPGYNTVQAAVTAATYFPGATILLCPGTYAEQVQVTTAYNLTIEAAQPRLGATLTMPTTPVSSTTPCDTAPGTGAYQPDQDGLAICGATPMRVTVKYVTFDEAWPAGTCDDSLYGILVGGGSTLSLQNSAIVAGGAVPINGCQGGVGIQIGMAWTTPNEAGHLTMRNTSVSGYQKNGMTIDGSGSTANISYDTVTGAGPTTQTAQNGIQVSNGALATISHTTVTHNECNNVTCGFNGYQAGGVLFYGAKAGSKVVSCELEHDDYGLYFASELPALSPSTENSVLFSTVAKNRYEDIIFDQGRDLVASDHIYGGDDGIQALQYQGQTYGDYDTIDSSQLHSFTKAAVQILSDQAATGDYPGHLTFQTTTIRGPILSNTSSYTITFLH